MYCSDRRSEDETNYVSYHQLTSGGTNPLEVNFSLLIFRATVLRRCSAAEKLAELSCPHCRWSPCVTPSSVILELLIVPSPFHSRSLSVSCEDGSHDLILSESTSAFSTLHWVAALLVGVFHVSQTKGPSAVLVAGELGWRYC